jgi:hypothetical protein
MMTSSGCVQLGCPTPDDRVRQYLNGAYCHQHQPAMVRTGQPHPTPPPTGLVARGKHRRYGRDTRTPAPRRGTRP